MITRNFKTDSHYFSKSLSEILEKQGHYFDAELVRSCDLRVEETGWDNWNGGTPVFTVYLVVSSGVFTDIHDRLEEIEATIDNASRPLKRLYPDTFWGFSIVPKPEIDADPSELIRLIEQQKSLMIAVATGGPSIRDVQDEYVARRQQIATLLTRFGILDPNPFADLWQWYGKWSADIPKWAPRRAFISEMYADVIDALSKIEFKPVVEATLTGWERVDRILAPIPTAIVKGVNTEDFQTVGLHCREALLSAAKSVYKDDMANLVDKTPGSADTKRQLEAFVEHAFSGPAGKSTRKMCRAAVDLANELTHDQDANRRDASICFESTKVVIAIVKILDSHNNCSSLNDPLF